MIQISDIADKWCYRGELYFNGVLQPKRQYGPSALNKIGKLNGYDFTDTGFITIVGEAGLINDDTDFFVEKLEEREVFRIYRFESELEKLQYKSKYCNET